jgi:hypothetical protein
MRGDRARKPVRRCARALSRRIPDGYIAVPSETYTGYAVLRSNVRSGSDADVGKAVAYGKRIKFYPLSQAANPPDTPIVDAIDVVYDSTIPYDLRFFPLLAQAAKEAHAWLDANYDALFSTPYFEATHWALPALPDLIEGMSTDFANPDSYPVDGRGVVYSFYFSAKHLGTGGQYYLMTIKDQDGQSFDGGRGYRLHVPPMRRSHCRRRSTTVPPMPSSVTWLSPAEPRTRRGFRRTPTVR